MPENREINLEEAVKIVTDIGLRYEKQLELAAAARIERQGEIYREKKGEESGN